MNHKIDKKSRLLDQTPQFYYQKSKAMATRSVIVDCVDIHLYIKGSPINELSTYAFVS